jgi:hypothetical protein
MPPPPPFSQASSSACSKELVPALPGQVSWVRSDGPRALDAAFVMVSDWGKVRLGVVQSAGGCLPGSSGVVLGFATESPGWACECAQ